MGGDGLVRYTVHTSVVPKRVGICDWAWGIEAQLCPVSLTLSQSQYTQTTTRGVIPVTPEPILFDNIIGVIHVLHNH